MYFTSMDNLALDGLRRFVDESIYFNKNILYLLRNIPNIVTDVVGDKIVMQARQIPLIEQIVERYKTGGPSEALILTRQAIEKKKSPLLLRLHAKYVFENDRSDIESALMFAKRAIHGFPYSLEYRFFLASILYNRALTAKVKDNLMYGEIILECYEALSLKNMGEPFWLVYMHIEKKTAHITTTEEANRYLHNCLRNMINMCIRAIDGLPKKVFEFKQSTTIDNLSKIYEVTGVLSSDGRFCAIAHRLYSQYSFDYASKHITDADLQMKWMDFSCASARIAHELYNDSIDYALNFCTIRLVVQKSYSKSVIKFLKDKIDPYITLDESQEPYCKYLTGNDFTNCAEQTEHYKKCILMFLSFVNTMEVVSLCHNHIQHDQVARSFDF